MIEQGLDAREQRWADRLDTAWSLATGGALLTALDAAHALLAELPGDGALNAGTHLLIGRIHLDLSYDPDRYGQGDRDRAIAHLRQGWKAALPGDLAALGTALAERYMDAEPGSAEESTALDEAIAELDAAVLFLPMEPDDPELIEAAVLLGILLYDRNEMREGASDRARAIDMLRTALPTYEQLDGYDADIRLMGCRAWGSALAGQISHSGESGDLDLAIRLLAEVVDAEADAWTPQDSSDYPDFTDQLVLADLLRQRSARDADRRDAERGIALLRPIVESLPADRPERGEVLHDLVLLYTVRCGNEASDRDLDAVISVAESALPVIEAPWNTQIALLLALQFTERARRRHHPDQSAGVKELAAVAQDPDFRTARALFTEHLPQLPEDHDLYPTAVAGALFALGVTIGEERGPQAVDRIADLAQKARTVHPATSEEYLLAVSLLGIALEDNGWRSHVPETTEEAIAALEEAVTLTPQDRDIRNLLWMNLGSARLSRAVAAIDLPAAQAALDLVVESYSRLTAWQRDSWLAADVLGRACFSAISDDLPELDSGPAVKLLERHLDDDPPVDPARRGAWLAYTGAALAWSAYRHESPADLDRAIGRLVEAVDLLPPGHAYRIVAMSQLATALTARYAQAGDASDLDAALGRLDRVRQELPPGNAELQLRLLDTLQEHFDLLRAPFTNDTASGRAGESALRAEFSQLENPAISASFLSRLRASRAVRHLSANAGTGDMDAQHAAVSELISAAQALPDGSADGAMYLAMASGMLRDPRFAYADYGLLSDSIQAIRRVLLGPVASAARCAALIHLSSLLQARYHLDHREPDRQESLDRARQALEAAETGSVVLNAVAHMWLANLLRAESGDRAEAVRAGINALTGLATEVFLQGDARDGLARTRHVADQAVEVADWCIQEGTPGQAVTALELGRGLLLHAATTAVDIGDLLESVGQIDLAAEWRRDGGEAAIRSPDTVAASTLKPAYVPSALRRRVLAALAELPQGHARLLATPSIDEIAAGLRAGERDALVYLIGATEDAPGRALAVLADGRVETVGLPDLDARPGSVLSDFAEQRVAYRRRSQSAEAAQEVTTPTPADAAERWRQALDAVSRWAWPAVVAPVLKLVQAQHRATSGPPSIVLVPFGELGAVPWHAACADPITAQHTSGRPRYALDDAVFSYAASARQFLETAGRARPDPGRAPLFVANTVHDLWWASLETAAIRSAHYPEAPYFGQIKGLPEIEVEPQELLSRLSGDAGAEPVTMLHVACHGESGSSPLDSCLYLSGMARLETRTMLRRAFDRVAPAPGGLVVLGSCLSDASEHNHDEALTVATAFVTAGATSVVGTQWEAPDRRSALLMFMFHHHLAAGARPVDALRNAQLWMLDPHREAPVTMPEYLATAVRRTPQSPADRLDTLDGWAAFVHHGW